MDSRLTSWIEGLVHALWPLLQQFGETPRGPQKAAFLIAYIGLLIPTIRTIAAAFRMLRARRRAAAEQRSAPSAPPAGPRPRKDPPRKATLVEFLDPDLSAPGVSFYTDECANGLGPHLRLVGLDVLTSGEAGMNGEKDDRQQLLRAQRDRRILLTYNIRDFRALDGVVPHAGIVLCPQGAEFIPEIQRVCLRLAEEGVGALS